MAIAYHQSDRLRTFSQLREFQYAAAVVASGRRTVPVDRPIFATAAVFE
jgi:hypothetical protein